MHHEKNQHFSHIGQIFNSIANIITVVSWIGIPFSLIFAFLFQSWQWIVLVVGCAILLFLIRYCRKNSSEVVSKILDLFAPNLPYQLSSWNINYEYKSLDELKFQAEYEVQALQTGVDYINVRYSWSGESEDNPIDPQPISGKKYVTDRVEHEGKEYGYWYYKIFSKTPYNKSDKTFWLATQIRLLRNDKKQISHHLQTSISVKTRNLHMRVVFPSDIRPSKVYAFEYLHSTDFYYWHTYDLDVVFDDEISKWVIDWTIPNPVMGGKYLMQWNPVYLMGSSSNDVAGLSETEKSVDTLVRN